MSWPAFPTFSNCSSSDIPRCLRFMSRRDNVASGLVSVMPHPWIISTPKVSWNQRMSDAGGADPPQVTRDSDDRS